MKSVEESILELRAAKRSCSQATLLGIIRGMNRNDLPETLLEAATVTLRGGIGGTFDEGSCGALTGAAIALGMLLADDGTKATALTKALYNSFKEKFGTVCCGKITSENGKKRCNECCLYAGSKVRELLTTDRESQTPPHHTTQQTFAKEL